MTGERKGMLATAAELRRIADTIERGAETGTVDVDWTLTRDRDAELSTGLREPACRVTEVRTRLTLYMVQR